MSEKSDRPSPAETQSGQDAEESRFSDLEELQREIDKRIRDNQRFLERFMDDDFEEEEEPEGEEDGDFEEL